MHYNKQNKPILDGSTKRMEAGLEQDLESTLLQQEKAERITNEQDDDEEIAAEILNGEDFSVHTEEIGTGLPFEEGNLIPELSDMEYPL